MKNLDRKKGVKRSCFNRNQANFHSQNDGKQKKRFEATELEPKMVQAILGTNTKQVQVHHRFGMGWSG